MHRCSRQLFPIFAAFVAVLVLASVAEACPSCKSALESSAEGRKLVQGYFWSICFMIAMPFTIFGALSGYMYYLVRAARRNGGPQAAAVLQPAQNETAGV